jgi:hypothetical protein
MLVAVLAMLVSRSGVFLSVVVLPHVVEMRRLKVMMRGGLMVSSRLKVMFARRMFC